MSDKKLSEAKQFLYNNTTSKIHEFNKESVKAMASFMVAFSKKENEQLQKQVEDIGKYLRISMDEGLTKEQYDEAWNLINQSK